MANDLGKIYLIFWCPPDTAPEFETSYLEDYGKVFATEVRVPGLEYVGRGVSSTKEGSKNNASIHYLMHLIRDGLLDKKRVARRVPCMPLGVRPDGSFDPSPLPDFLEPVTDETFGQYNFPSERDRDYEISPAAQSSRPRQREDDAHGNWTLENAIEGLHMYFGRDISDRFKYCTSGSGNSSIVSCDLILYVKELGEELHGWGQGKTTATASSQCALSFIRQLYRKNLIGPYEKSYRGKGALEQRGGGFQSRRESTVRDLNAALQKNQDSRISGGVQEHVPLQILVPRQAISHVVGTDGNIIKRIEIKTGAKITYPEKIRGDDLEGRIFTLIGEPDKVQAAAYIINKIIQWALVKAANSLKEALTFGENIDASQSNVIASGHPSIQANTSMANNSNQQSSTSQELMTDISTKNIESMQIVVPQKAVGYIIGKEGSVIKSIERESGVLINFISIEKESRINKDGLPGDRQCTLTGTSPQIQIASSKINAIIQHVEQSGNLPSSFLQSQGLMAASKDTTMVIPIPLDLVGYVIGKEGATIKRIQKQSGAIVKFNYDKKLDIGEKRCEIIGSLDKVEAAAKAIRWVMHSGGKKSGTAASTPQQNQSNTTVTDVQSTVETEELTQENENSTSVAITQETSVSKPETEVVSPTSQKNDTEQALKDETEVSSPSQENEDSVTDPKDKPSEILIPEEIFGFVVGKNNSTMDHISRSTGVKISIEKRKLYNKSGVRKCSVTGTPDQVKTATKRINALINIGTRNAEHSKSVQAVQAQDAQVTQPTQATSKPIKGASRLEILVPQEVAECVIGKDEATINRISKDTGANIVLLQNEAGDRLGIRKCVITGAPGDIITAARRINALINVGVVSQATISSISQQIPHPVPTSNTFGYPPILGPPPTIQSAPPQNQYPMGVGSLPPWQVPPVPHPMGVGGVFGNPPPFMLPPPSMLPAPPHPMAVGNMLGNLPPLHLPPPTIQSAPPQNQYPMAVGSLPGNPPPWQVPPPTIQSATPQNQYSMAVENLLGSTPPSQMKNTPPTSQKKDRMSIIDALEKQLSKKNKVQSTSQQNQDTVPKSIGDPPLELKSKKILPKPQKNWYRMAVSNSDSMNAIQSLKGYEFVLEPGLERAVGSVLASLKINPMTVPEKIQGNFPFSLKLKQIVSTGRIFASSQPDTVMRWWSPPQKNWDPWINNTIDEPPLSEMSLEQIGTQLMAAHYSKIQNDETLQNLIKERKKAYTRLYQHEILHTVKNNSVTIIHGPSGTGKTTQVPQYILDSYITLEHGAECCILVAQPRRVTTIATAERTAKARSEALGNSIGYEVLFETCFPRPYGCIMFCTLGVLLKRLEAGIRGVSHIILDEVHERNAKSDFIMAILRDMVKAFPHLRVVLMSASIDITPLKQYFSNCAVIEVPLETHPVQEYYLEDIIQVLGFMPPQNENNEETEYCDQLDDKEDIKSYEYVNYGLDSVKGVSFDLITALLTYIKSLNVAGAILIFLPDCNTIYTLMIQLQNHSAFGSSSYLCLPLHSEISREDMESVSQPAPSGVTKIILSTNIAESAVTLRDIVYVIDSCKIVSRRFTSNNNAINYTIAWAAKSNLEQRSRQASFVQPGCCFRLCSRECFSKLKNDIIPELHYTSLHEIILSIKQLRLGNSKQFLSKTLKPPTAKSILDAEEFLSDLGALDKSGNLTPLGRMLARLPVEPRLGKMIILACLFSLGDTSCLLAVHNTIYPESSAPNLEKFVGYRCSDHIAFLNAFTQWENRQTEEKQAEKEFCEQNNLSSHILKLAHNGKKQLKEIVQSMGFPERCLEQKNHCLTDHDANVDMIIALLVLGLHPNICFHKESKNATESRTELATSFNSPFFVFGRKICTEEATYKDMTMISVVHLLLFGNHNVELLRGRIQIDSWIELKMDPKTVSKIVAVRSALETLIGDVAANPKLLASLRTPSCQLLDIVKALCNEIDDQYKAVPQYDTKSVSSAQMEPPYKRRFLAADSWSSSDIQRTENQFNEYYRNPNIGHPLNNIPFGNVRNNASDYRSPVDSRNASAESYTSDNKYFERRALAGGMDENGASRFGNEIFQRHSAAGVTEELRASRFGINRGDNTYGKTLPGTTAKSDLGYWSHGMGRR